MILLILSYTYFDVSEKCVGSSNIGSAKKRIDILLENWYDFPVVSNVICISGQDTEATVLPCPGH